MLFVRDRAFFDLETGVLTDILRDSAELEPFQAEALSLLSSRVARLGSGGVLVITELSEQVSREVLHVGYALSPPFTLLRDAAQDELEGSSRSDEARLSSALDFVSSLSQTDGAVLLHKDLSVVGFGGKFQVRYPLPQLHDYGDSARRLIPVDSIGGMRHRSAASFCDQHRGFTLAIVESQDGDVTLFGRVTDDTVARLGPFALGIGLSFG